MATICFEGQSVTVADGEKILARCEEMGVPLGCQDGLCGTCIVTVLKGSDNLAPSNDKEVDMDLDEGQRLACQCVIVSGEVHIASE